MMGAVPVWGWAVIAADVALYVAAVVLLVSSANIGAREAKGEA